MPIRPAHSGVAREVPPMSYQPVLHGAEPQIRPLLPSGGSEMKTSAPVRGLDCSPMSGTPRWPLGIGVLPAGSTSWNAGRLKTWLKPPPVAMPRDASPHTISACPCASAAWHAAGGSVLSTTRADVLFGSVHSAVPPTPV